MGAVYGMTEVHVGAVLTRANSAVSTGTIGTDPHGCRVTSTEYRWRKGGHKCMRGRMHNSQVGRARFARRGANLPDGARFSARPFGGDRGDTKVTLVLIPIFISLNIGVIQPDLNRLVRTHACVLSSVQVSGRLW